ncbi:MAG: thioredoxin family protein [bacterium]
MLDIKILGPGCPRCYEVEKRTKEVIEELKLDVNVEKISDLKKIMEYKIMATPGLVINGKVVFSGKIPAKSQIRAWIEQAMK